MDDYSYKYKNTIENLYGEKRMHDIDELLLEDNILPHIYSIKDRVDMTKYDVYSIDPEGCEDADDAFSIYMDNNKLFLAIHIADPTEYINIESSLWKDIEIRLVTKYPSHKKPIHMIPDIIMQKSSLIVNDYGNIKLAISIITEIDKESYKPIGNIQLSFTKIKLEKSHSLSYKNASDSHKSNEVLSYGIKITESLKTIREKKTKGIVLNEISNSYTKSKNDTVYLHKDTKTEKLMKEMIAEFAIFANTFVGEYLKINFEGKGLYRICNASKWLESLYDDITGNELLNEIIVNGIKAEYMSMVSSHDLIGSPEYCHFTSPIRRMSDCVCHYLLKYIYLRNKNNELKVPFTNDELEIYSNNCMYITKKMKNIQYKDTKFRIIQAINTMLKNNEIVNIGYYISGYTGLFLNIIINSINEHSVYISYTLRIPNLKTIYKIKEINYLVISRVNCINKFDQGSIPELDEIYM